MKQKRVCYIGFLNTCYHPVTGDNLEGYYIIEEVNEKES